VNASGLCPVSVDASPVRRVIFLTRLEMKEAGFSFVEPSFPGHHIQVNESGRLHVETCGRTFEIGPGGLMWLHNDEEFRYRVLEAPRRFYVLNFHAPTLPPPPFEARCVTLPGRRIVPRFRALLQAWRNTTVPPMLRLLRVHSLLLQVLADVSAHMEKSVPLHQEVTLWWQIEAELRKDLSRPIDVQQMGRWVDRSAATITRACERAVGVSPAQRLKLLRLSMARGLLWMTGLSVSQVADRVGYSRVQELSREYRRKYHVTPTEDRERFPRVYEEVFGMPYSCDHRWE